MICLQIVSRRSIYTSMEKDHLPLVSGYANANISVQSAFVRIKRICHTVS